MNTENSPYHGFTREELILRDYLAADRTALANERTFLAYVRTALTFFVTGVTFIKIFDDPVLTFTGWIFMPLGLFIFIAGLIRYLNMRRDISKLRQAENINSVTAVTTPPDVN